MATLPTQTVPHTGLTPTYVAASAGGDKCSTGSGLVLHVKNADAAAHTLTLVTPATVDGDLVVADRPVTVAAGGAQFVPLLDLYRDRSTGLASVTYDAVTSLTVAVLRVA